MEAKEEQRPTNQHDTLFENIIDALPFIFAVVVIMIVVLEMMGPQIGNVYSNIGPNL